MTAISPKLPYVGVDHKGIATQILDHAPSVRVMVVGDIIMDKYTHGEARRLSPEAPVPVVDQSVVEWCLGGAANVAANLRAMGAEVSIVGTVGRDEAGERAVWSMSKLGIHVTGMVTSADRHTAVKHRILVGGRHMLRVDNEPRHAMDPELRKQIHGFILETISRHDGVIVSDYRKGVVDAEVLRAIRTWNGSRNKVVGLDTKPDRLLEMSGKEMKGITFCKPNRAELFAAMKMKDDPDLMHRAGLSNPRLLEAINRWFEWSTEAPYLLVTLAEAGMVMAHESAPRKAAHIPALGSQVVEVSGGR